MSWGAIGAAAIGGAVSIGGGLLAGSGGGGGGGGGGMNLKDMTALLDRYKAEAAQIVGELDSKTSAATSKADAKVTASAEDLRKAGSKSEKELLGRLDALNKQFVSSLSVFADKFPQEVEGAIGGLTKAVDALNKGSRQDTVKQLDAFIKGAEKLDEQFKKESDDSIQEFLTSQGKATKQFETKSDRVIDQTKEDVFAEDQRFQETGDAALEDFGATNRQSERRFENQQRLFENQFGRQVGREARGLESTTKSLGDLFLDQVQQTLTSSRAETDALRSQLESGTMTVDAEAEAARSIAFNTANLGNFIGIADELSQGAFATRQRLVDQADPRARELSAIVDENAAALMSGRISADVQANVARSSAMRALSGGFGAGSDMGRGLTARDLGLTSLDLMRQGAEMNDAQRRLIYDTRVAGTQVDPFAVMQESGLSTEQAIRSATSNADMVNRDRIASAEIGARNINARMDSQVGAFGTNLDVQGRGAIEASRLRADSYRNIFDSRNEGAYRRFVRRGDEADATLETTIGMAQSGRNTRIGAINDAGTQRLQNYDRIFASDLARADTVRGQRMTTADARFRSGLDVGRDYLRTSLANTYDIYNNNFGLAGTIFNSRVGTAEKMLGIGTGMVSDIYKTGVTAGGSIYDAQNTREGNIFSGKTTTANNLAGIEAAAAIKAADIKATAAGGAAQGGVSMALQDMVNQQGNRQANANLWGSAIQSGATLAGSFMGSQNWLGGARNPYGTGLNAKTGFYDTAASAQKAYGPGAQIARWGADGYFNTGYK